MPIDRRNGSQHPKHIAAYDTATSKAYVQAARERAIAETALERKIFATQHLSYGTPIGFREMILEDEQGGLVSRDVRQGEMSFSTIREKRSGEGRILALDAAGQGGFKRDYLGVDAEVAITLVDFRKERARLADKAARIEVVEGDLLDPRTFDDVHRFVQEYDDRPDPRDRGIDVALCEPIRGWATILGATNEGVNVNDPRAALLEWMVANRIYQTLRPGSGTMYFQLGRTGNYNGWMDTLQTEDVHAALGTSYYNPHIRITKTGERQNLPFLPSINKPRR